MNRISRPIYMDDFAVEILKYIPADSNYNIFDIGSMNGNDARKLKEYFPNSSAYAFEASIEEYNAFAHLNKDINWINQLIYDVEEPVDFHKKTFGTGIHSIRDRGAEHGNVAVEKLTPMRIDTFCNQNCIDRVDIVKIDAEGCSLEVLRSFGTLIHTVSAIHVETERCQYFAGQHLEDEVYSFLIQNGFDLLMENRIGDEYYKLEQSDSIWIRKDLISENAL